MNTESQTPTNTTTKQLALLRDNVYRAAKAIAIVVVCVTVYTWIVNNTEWGKRFKFSNELFLSVGSGIVIAIFQYADTQQKQRLEAAKEVQEENRMLINANHEKLTNAVGILERRIDSALLQINQQQTDFGETLISINQIQAELEDQEDTIAQNRHESLEKDFEVYKELANVKIELMYIKGLLHLPNEKNPPSLPGGR